MVDLANLLSIEQESGSSFLCLADPMPGHPFIVVRRANLPGHCDDGSCPRWPLPEPAHSESLLEMPQGSPSSVGIASMGDANAIGVDWRGLREWFVEATALHIQTGRPLSFSPIQTRHVSCLELKPNQAKQDGDVDVLVLGTRESV